MGACSTKTGCHQPEQRESEKPVNSTLVLPSTSEKYLSSSGKDGPVTPTRTTSKQSRGDRAKAVALDQHMFILEKVGKIKEHYHIEKNPLGVGAYGSVCKGTHKKTSAQRAIKAISKAQMKNLEQFKQEVDIMKKLDHPNIIKLFETFEDQRNIYLVMELCSGGELFDRILKAGNFAEVTAAILMQQILRAIYYMHEKNFCHRDLKPENFLFQNKSDPIDKNILKIIDFGLSTPFTPGQPLKTKAGTPYYVAPQVLAGKYDQASDLWSCGVIMYVLLCGYPPFYGDTDAEVLTKVRQGTFTFKAADWRHVTEDAKDLVRQLLKYNPKDRFTAEQALNHAWIKDKAPKASANVSLQADFVDHLRGFRHACRLKKAALQIIAGQMDAKQIKTLRETFVALDENGDGLLTVAEMEAGLTKAGLRAVDLQEIIDDVDANGSGVIDYTEFLAATMRREQYVQEDLCWRAFATFDQNGDGKISPEELKQVLHDKSVEEALSSESVAEIVRQVDGNGDGVIDFDEFMHMMRVHATSPATKRRER